ncbi:MAG: hypothetical protein GY782_05370 [Gammaproteobacteria bacterium]|nr:hypothetical protein [Gammaproteobacteria bacterium]
MSSSDWRTPGASLSDKNARLEYKITQEEIIAQMRSGRFKYQQNVMHGNPYYKLLRHEIEEYIFDTYGVHELQRRQYMKRLEAIEKALRKHKRQITILNKEKVVVEKQLSTLA